MGKGSLRNKKPCPTCGLNKRYKDCCLDLDLMKEREAPQKVVRYFQKKEAERKLLEEMGIRINLVNPIIYQGKKVWAVGSQILIRDNIHETFHDLIISILLRTLGKDWYDIERIKSGSEQHFIIKCLDKYNQWQNNNSTKLENKIDKFLFTAKPDGWLRSLSSLAFDIFSLVHTNQLPLNILERLKIRSQYQGARYEISISAIFARLGCKIKFLDEGEKISGKHCDFIITHEATNTIIAIEVKSRHRKGVIHQEGVLDERKALKAAIEPLLNEALEQNPGNVPFMVFIDMNSPLTPNTDMQNKPWFKDIHKTIGKMSQPSPENPDPLNAVVFTNYSYHYQTENEADPGEHIAIISIYPKFPFVNIDVVNMLLSALNHYGNVPNVDLENNNLDEF